MKIRKLKCDQFAGVIDREYVFSDGLNLLVGANESGKSTMVDLLYIMLFQNAKLDKRRDKDFFEKYFPNTIGKYSGDEIDGKMSFETNSGRYTIFKKWSTSGGENLMKLPDGTRISDPENIRKVLETELVYHRGVYDELIFASQRRISGLLKGLLGTSSDNVDSIASAISKNVIETGGIDVDAIKKKLADKLTEFEGNWDFSRNLPKGGRGIDNPWAKNIGAILNAYYKKERILSEYNKTKNAEEEITKLNRWIESRNARKHSESEKLENFLQYQSAISAFQAQNELLSAKNNELDIKMEALKNWPEQEEKLRTAKDLHDELQYAILRLRFDDIEPYAEKLEECKVKLTELGDISEEDVNAAENLAADIKLLERQTDGVNVSAKISTYGDSNVKVVSSISGEEICGIDGVYNIEKAVTICIPGVADIQLSPEGIDVSTVVDKISENRAKQSEIFKKYDVVTLDQLQEKQSRFKELARSRDQAQQAIELKTNDWDDLKAKVSTLPDNVRDFDVVNGEILQMCGDVSVDGYIGNLNAVISHYKDNYVSINELQSDIYNLQNRIQGIRSRMDDLESIPEEYKGIDDPDKYRGELKKQIEHYEGSIEEFRKQKNDVEKGLGDKTTEDLAEEHRAAEQEFQRVLDEYNHWKNIKANFDAVLEKFKGNPFQDVECYFRENLATLSNGKLNLNSVDDNLGSAISSGKNKLKEGILSEGTKDTISLAFRLAVLKYLFPNGGGLAVFDDPFTDMDPERTQQACKLVQEFARDNQVIFVTCDNKYTTMLTGNVIPVAD